MVRIVVLSVLSFFLPLQGGSSVAQSLQRLYVDDGVWLGVSVTDLSKKIINDKKLSAKEGALVNEVMEESPAEEAGIRKGDVIVRFDGRDIADSDDLVRAVRRGDAGDEVKIVVERKGESKTLTATLEDTRRGKSFAFRVPSVPKVAPVPGARFRLDLLQHGTPAGLSMRELGKQLGEYFEVPGKKGVLVTSVRDGSAGEKAGVKAGDVIVRINGSTVRDVGDCLEEIRDSRGDDVRLELIRRGTPVEVTVTLDPSDRKSRGLFYDDGTAGTRNRLRHLKEGLPADREALEELRDRLRKMKEELRDDLGENIRESFPFNLRDLREFHDGLRETIHEQLPLLRRMARAAFLSI